MKKKEILRTALVLAIVGLLLSCTSFPAPRSEEDTLLIIPLSTVRGTSQQFFANCEIRIVRIEDNRETFYQIDPNSNYGMIAGLPPGQYAIRETAGRYKGGPAAFTRKTDIAFSLVVNCITILPQEFVFKIEKIADEDQYQMWLGWGDLTQSTAKKLLQRLVEEENYQLWQLSESTKENAAVAQALSEL